MEVRRLRDDELQHHGVKGQRWGVRRYQNYDGSLKNSSGNNNGNNSSTTTVYTNRKTYTTGKSKGVKKRSKLNNSTSPFTTSKNQNNYTTHYDNSMKKNTVKFKTRSSVSGKNFTEANLKDEESASNFYALMNSIYLHQDPTVADQTVFILIEKYGELEFDTSKLESSDNPYECFTNVSKEDQLSPGLALNTSSGSNSSNNSQNHNGMPSNIENKLTKQVGYNGMPSSVVKYVKGKTNTTNNYNKKARKVSNDYISNGAPSSVKKSKKTIRLTAPRRTTINSANQGSNGMSSNIPTAAFSNFSGAYKKKKR